MPREWSTNVRDPWNAPIHQILKAIDNHTRLYLETGDPWHSTRAETLRKYLKDLKDWVFEQEGKMK